MAAAAAAPMGVQQVDIEGRADTDFGKNTVSLNKLSPDLKDVPQSVTVLSKTLRMGATSKIRSVHVRAPYLNLGEISESVAG
jgi:hypothetical protein